MKKSMRMAVLAAVLMAVPLVAVAGEVIQLGGNPYGGGQQKAGVWRQFTYNSTTPARFVLLDRVGLTDDQQKVLDEVYEEWSTQRNKAYADIRAKLVKLTAEEQKDPEKVKAYTAKRTELYKAAQVALPTDQINAVLTPDQQAKIAEAGKVLADWDKWLTEYMAKYAKQLDELLGPAPEQIDAWANYRYTMLDTYLKGASWIGNRLGLTKEQETALLTLQAETVAELYAMTVPLGSAQRAETEGKGYVQSVLYPINQKCSDIVNEKFRQGVEAILTKEQRDKVAKACAIMDERSKGLIATYVDYATKVSKILPPEKRKADAPVIMRGPGGGVDIMMPDLKAGAPEGRTIVIPGGGGTVVLPGQKAGSAGGTVIIIGGENEGDDKD